MKILVLNCGSSSIKYQVLSMGAETRLLCKGLAERVGQPDSRLEHEPRDGRAEFVLEEAFPTHAEGVAAILRCLVDPQHGVIADMSELEAVGHRVAHGGQYFAESVLIDPEVEEKIELCNELAPLHNPANLMGIRAVRKHLPHVPQVAVFDTAFHQTLPRMAYLYALPHRFYSDLHVRKYGFHGTSHRYVSRRAAQELQRDPQDLKIISCHLGNGASITAVDGGRSVETSMGFTPVDGLMMGTRCGEVDPGALLYIAEKEDLGLEGLNRLINKESGLLGLSGISHDMRDLQAAQARGDEWAKAARELFVYRVRKYIAQYYGVMGGVDAIVFTGGVGEHDRDVRKEVCQHLDYLGVDFCPEANQALKGEMGCISCPESKVKVFVIPTNEELVIAEDTQRIVTSNR